LCASHDAFVDPNLDDILATPRTRLADALIAIAKTL